MEETERIQAEAVPKANHLCVLVHGLWGKPSHLDALAAALKKKYGEDQLHVLVASRNSEYFTYDGIDIGGERVANEVEEELDKLEKDGHKITKFSIIGYSLGGLISRYCIGLLLKKLENIELVNFITFASPHLGVRTPLRGYHSSLWNALGSRTLSTSGRQLFLIDAFRDDGRPLLSILADPNSIFIKALLRFKNRALYANVVNDRSAPWYTTGISRTDPFEDVERLDIHYLEGYAPTILDPSHPPTLAELEDQGLYNQITTSAWSFLTRLPLLTTFTLLAPIGAAAFLVNAGIQSVRSGYRIRLHEQGLAGLDLKPYRIPFMIEVRNAMEGAFETFNAIERQEYLSDSESSPPTPNDPREKKTPRRASTNKSLHLARTKSKADEFPTLALAPEQFAMIDTLDKVGFRKFPVYIHECRHSHAAIIVRYPAKKYEEGHLVIKHWLDHVFEI